MHSPFDLLAFLLVLAAGLAYANHRTAGLPLSVGLLLGASGLALILLGFDAVLPALGLKLALRDLLARVDFPAALLNGFLAFLLFAGALEVELTTLFERKWPILALATVGTILSTGLVAGALAGLSAVLGLNLPFPWCLVFGALISPTDPVAVLGALKRVGIPRTLQATVAGESLFNDGVGVVLFSLVLALATGEPAPDLGPTTVIGLFLLQAVGGGLLGLGLGYAASLLIRQVDEYNVELILSLALVTGTYSLAGGLGVSGPVAVVVAGLLIGNQESQADVGETTRLHLRTFWHLVDETLNALLFLLIGLEIAAVDLTWRSLAAMLAMIPACLAIRWVSVAASALPLTLHLPNRLGAFTILTWGGLRGGLSVAMALALPESPVKSTILTIAYGVVVFSIVVQGLTLERVAKRVLPGRSP